jgi:hypothetical protein
MASWVSNDPTPPDTALYYVAPQDLSEPTKTALERLGAKSVGVDYVNQHYAGTLLWLDAGPNGLPDTLGERGSAARVVLLAGPNPTFHENWQLADYVVGGEWPSAVRELESPQWQASLR